MSEQPDPPLGTLKQVDAGLLSVGYPEAGPADGPAVILLHGWPYDIRSYAEVTPVLAAAGYRVVVPLASSPVITVPTITLEGDANGAPHPEPGAYRAKLTVKRSGDEVGC